MKTWGRTSADEHLRTMDSSFARLPAMSGSYTTSAPRQTTGICFNSKSEKADCQQLHKIQNRLRCVSTQSPKIWPAAMMTSAPISLSSSSEIAVQSSFSTLTAGVVCSLSPFSRTLSLSFCSTVEWQSLKMNRFGLHDRQTVIPVNPAPLPSSSTVLKEEEQI